MFQRAFSVSTREPAAPVFWAGGRLPHRGFVVCCNGGMFVRLTDCVSCAIRRARSFVCTIACVHDRGRAVPVAVVHGRAWPSCLWPWCRGRDHGRAVSAVAVRHVVAVAVPWRGRRALDVVTSLDMAVVTWPWRPWVWPWRGVAVAVASAVFVSPSCGCDTPMNASVCNGFNRVSLSRFAQSIGCV